MQFLPIIPALIAAYVAWQQSVWRAFVNIYIPVLLLLPMYYRWVIPMLPDPTFEQATIVPIAAVFFLRDWRSWMFSFTDFLVLGFAGCIGYSEFINAGYDEAQNLMFDMIASFVLPYILTKGLVSSRARSVLFAKRIVTMFLAVCIISLYEFRMGVTPWTLLFRHFYPGQGTEWVTTFRYGFARIAGPYGHAILAGLVLLVGYRLQRWLQWSGEWTGSVRYLKWTRLSKARIITLVLVGGIIMTMVRGPWLGGFAGGLVAAIGRTRHRKAAGWAIVFGVLLIGVPAASLFYSYASVGRAHAKTTSQETAAYRMELLDKYVAIALDHGYWGYGRNTWPRVAGAPSIDNYYLLLCLMHGLVAVGFLISIIILTTFRLIRVEMRSPVTYPLGGSLGFALAGIYLVYVVTLGTVYMGLQAIPVFAIITGWSEGYLIRHPSTASSAAEVQYSFERVVV